MISNNLVLLSQKFNNNTLNKFSKRSANVQSNSKIHYKLRAKIQESQNNLFYFVNDNTTS